MKLSLASCLLAAGLSTSTAFVVQSPSSGLSSTQLLASKAASQKLKRAAWLEKRGFGASATSTDTDAEAAAAGAGLMTNEEGLEYVQLSNGASSAQVYLFGGVVTSYKDAEGTEFIAVRPDAKMDGSKPISGGLSHCWPQVRDFIFSVWL